MNWSSKIRLQPPAGVLDMAAGVGYAIAPLSSTVNEVASRLVKLEQEGTANSVLLGCVESLLEENRRVCEEKDAAQAKYDLLLGKYMELVDRVAGLLPPVKAHEIAEDAESTCMAPRLL